MECSGWPYGLDKIDGVPEAHR
eukprot:gene4586-biopygen3826